MRSHLIFPLALFLFSLHTAAQNTFPATGAAGVGTGTTPHASSLFEVRSTAKGFLPPRMTNAQRNSIASPAQGLMIFQTDGAAGFYYYNSGWKAVTPLTSAANKALSNLTTTTAVNQHLLPSVTNTRNFGSLTQGWKDLYVTGDVYMDGSRFIANPGTGNAFFGALAGNSVTTGFFNTASGDQALFSNVDGRSNTANGFKALYFNTGTYNSAAGYVALFNNTTGYANNADGAYALYTNTTGSYNTAFGADALINNQTGNNNTAVGLDALRNITSTSLNTAIGFYAADATYDATQGTFLGAQTRGGTGFSNITAVGFGAATTASNQVMLGNTAVTSVRAAGSFVIYSDGRFKKDIKEEVPGLEFINKLRPVTYHYNMQELNKFMSPVASINQQGVSASAVKEVNRDEENSRKSEQAIAEKEKKLYSGFVAQDVEEIAKQLNYDFSGIYKPQGDKDVYGLSYSDFVVPLVKAVQELSKENEELKRKVADVEDLQKQLAELKALITKTNSNNTSVNISLAYLEQNSPNPARGITTIRYGVPDGVTSARFTLNNSKGQLIKTINITGRGAGQVNLDTSSLSAGMYNYTLWIAGLEMDTKQLLITR